MSADTVAIYVLGVAAFGLGIVVVVVLVSANDGYREWRAKRRRLERKPKTRITPSVS